jgi:putative heme-binding domain-containing protein
MQDVLTDERQPLARRKAALDLVKRCGTTPYSSAIEFLTLLDSDAFRSAAIPLLARFSKPEVTTSLLAHFDKFDSTDRNAALAVMCSRATLALPLLHAVQSGAFDRSQLTALQVRQLRNLHDATVDKMLDQTWGKVNESSEAAKATIAKLKKTYTAAPLWAYNGNAGKETFTQVCAVCHAFNGVGGKVGPDLGGSWRNGLDYFLENIVDPNAVVGENYQLHVITRKDGSVISGLIEQESGTAVTLRTLTESLVIAKSDIKDHQKLAQSLMPPGLLEALPERRVIELLKFLTSRQ